MEITNTDNVVSVIKMKLKNLNWLSTSKRITLKPKMPYAVKNILLSLLKMVMFTHSDMEVKIEVWSWTCSWIQRDLWAMVLIPHALSQSKLEDCKERKSKESQQEDSSLPLSIVKVSFITGEMDNMEFLVMERIKTMQFPLQMSIFHISKTNKKSQSKRWNHAKVILSLYWVTESFMVGVVMNLARWV